MGRPLVFAHRGSSYDLPEHTLAAYLRALEEGADGLECDVRLTRDGHLVCVHDRRLDRTSNGSGLVSARTLAELDALDFGSWHRAATLAEDDAPLDESHTRLLTLERLLDAVLDAGRPVRLLIETKHPSRYRGEVERRLVALLRRYGLDEPRPGRPVQVTVMSFSPLALRRNYDALKTEFMAFDTTDIRQSRAVKKNIAIQEGGTVHRAGPLLEDVGSATDPCPQPFNDALGLAIQ